MQPRCVQWCEISGRKYHVVGGIVSHAVVNPTFDPVAKAGAMHDYFRGNPDKLQPYEFLREREPIPAEYRNRDGRIAKLDEFGVEAVWLFPTLGVLYEELIKHDIEAVTTLFSGFNRWLDDDWGFDYQGRVFASPYITLADLDWAIRELEWALEHGARTVVMRPAAPHTRDGQVPVSDPRNDPFWARVNEAGITVVAHAGDSGYSSNGYAVDGFAAGFSGGGRWAPSVKAFHIERAAYDFLVTLVFDKLFERFPNVRIASVENGAEFLGDLFHKLRSTDRKMPGYFTEQPVDDHLEATGCDVVDQPGDHRVRPRIEDLRAQEHAGDRLVPRRQEREVERLPVAARVADRDRTSAIREALRAALEDPSADR